MSVFHPKKDHILSLSDEVVVHILSFLSSGKSYGLHEGYNHLILKVRSIIRFHEKAI